MKLSSAMRMINAVIVVKNGKYAGETGLIKSCTKMFYWVQFLSCDDKERRLRKTSVNIIKYGHNVSATARKSGVVRQQEQCLSPRPVMAVDIAFPRPSPLVRRRHQPQPCCLQQAPFPISFSSPQVPDQMAGGPVEFAPSTDKGEGGDLPVSGVLPDGRRRRRRRSSLLESCVGDLFEEEERVDDAEDELDRMLSQGNFDDPEDSLNADTTPLRRRRVAFAPISSPSGGEGEQCMSARRTVVMDAAARPPPLPRRRRKTRRNLASPRKLFLKSPQVRMRVDTERRKKHVSEPNFMSGFLIR